MNLQKRIFKEFSGFEISDVMFSNSSLVCSSLVLNKPSIDTGDLFGIHGILNLNHAFVKHIIDQYVVIKESSELKKIVHESIEIIALISFDRKDLNDGIDQLNNIIKPLYSNTESYTFKKDEFIIEY